MIEMTIEGDKLIYKNALGGVELFQSISFTKALCDLYFGSDPVSPSHKTNVSKGIQQILQK